MMYRTGILVFIGFLVCIFLLKGIYDKIKFSSRLRASLLDAFGKEIEKDYKAARYESLSYYHKRCIDGTENTKLCIDHHTYADLDLDLVYKQMNHTRSGLGEEYLYHALCTPLDDPAVHQRRRKLIAHYKDNDKDRVRVEQALVRLGTLKKASAFEYIDRLMLAPVTSPAFSLVMDFLILLCLGLSVVLDAGWIAGFLVLLVVNICLYSRYKHQSFFQCFGYIAKLAKCADEILNAPLPLSEEDNQSLQKKVDVLHGLSRYAWVFKQGSELGGSALDLLMDYIKMMFHVDVIIFDFCLKRCLEIKDEIDAVAEIIGEVDSCIAVASFQTMQDEVCVPTLYQGDAKDHLYIRMQAMYHPLIKDPVKNDLEAHRLILLTGSNASGKSTFLKAAAINAIFAETYGFALAVAWESPYMKVCTSMRHGDDIEAHDSYFMAELKAIRRISETAQEDYPVFCLLDEVLSGTNTLERIAAAAQILRYFSQKRMICFCATHDIELTRLLEAYYDNYHFSELLTEGDITFDYKLKEGPSDTRNAIGLLGNLGFDRQIVDAAYETAKTYETQGIWSL